MAAHKNFERGIEVQVEIVKLNSVIGGFGAALSFDFRVVRFHHWMLMRLNIELSNSLIIEVDRVLNTVLLFHEGSHQPVDVLVELFDLRPRPNKLVQVLLVGAEIVLLVQLGLELGPIVAVNLRLPLLVHGQNVAHGAEIDDVDEDNRHRIHEDHLEVLRPVFDNLAVDQHRARLVPHRVEQMHGALDLLQENAANLGVVNLQVRHFARKSVGIRDFVVVREADEYILAVKRGEDGCAACVQNGLLL